MKCSPSKCSHAMRTIFCFFSRVFRTLRRSCFPRKNFCFNFFPFKMGKKQHQKDKLYITTTEWREQYGGCKDETILKAQQAKFKRLPFDCCCVSLQPFRDPMCSIEGNIYDITNIVPFVKKFGKNPVTGEKLDAKSLVKLTFHKNSEGEYHCPVTYRVFTNTSHVVAVRQTGNVYSYEAVEELNLKTKNFKDLLTDEPFTRKDIITLQDPEHLEKFNISTFYHVKHRLKVEDDEEEFSRDDPMNFLKVMNTETKETLAQLKRDYKPEEKKIFAKPKADAVNAAHYSTGMVAAGFTSSVMDPVTEHEAAIVDETKLRYNRVTKKGYVRLVTNFGPLNFELHCDLTPKTCDNFIQLCRSGYYKQTKFHRLIKNFMVQGGDPTNTGTGGQSIWNKTFEDEFKMQLSHSGRGILSMANRGTNTNTSQFFITFRSCKHLDQKHTIFGRLVGGFETLTAIENIKVDEKDQPQEEIIVLDTQVFIDPYEEADEMLKREREEIQKKKSAQQKVEMQKKQPGANEELKVYKPGVGKYIKPTPASKESVGAVNSDAPKSKKSKLAVASKGLSNFDSW